MSNKDKIMEAATELFHSYGYDGTSIHMLITKAGVSKSNFYYYFEGKEELGLIVLTRLADDQIREFSEIVETDFNAVEQLIELYKEAVSSHRDLLSKPIYPGSFFGNIALEQSSINEKFRSVVDNYFRECEAFVEKCLRKGMEQGVFYEDLDPQAMSRYMVCHFEGAVLRAKAKKSLSPIEDMIRQGKNLVLKPEWTHLADEI